MKIALDAQLLFEREKTGIGWNTKIMIDELIKEGSNQIVLNVYDFTHEKRRNEIIKEYAKKGCIIRRNYYMPPRVYNRLIRMVSYPYKWLFKADADITQFFNFTLPPGTGTPVSTWIYDMGYKAHPETLQAKTVQWLGENMQSYCDRADFVITISEFSKREMLKYLNIDANKIEVIPCAVDTQVYHDHYQENEIEKSKKKYSIDGDYILYVGTLEPRKNIPQLIDAYKKVKDRRSDIPKLVLAGKKGWMYDEIFAKVREYKIEDDVVFTGYVDEEDVPRLMSGAEMFVFPSLYEGFGMPPLEAMACGTPVIVTDVASLPEVVGDAGVQVPVGDADVLAEQIIRLMEDESLREELSKAGIERASGYTGEAAVQMLLKVYRTRLRHN